MLRKIILSCFASFLAVFLFLILLRIVHYDLFPHIEHYNYLVSMGDDEYFFWVNNIDQSAYDELLGARISTLIWDSVFIFILTVCISLAIYFVVMLWCRRLEFITKNRDLVKNMRIERKLARLESEKIKIENKIKDVNKDGSK